MRTGARRSLLLAGAVAALAAACDGGGPPVRGFGSRQIFSSSDPTLSLLFWNDGAPEFVVGGQDRFRIDPTSGQVTPVSDQPVVGAGKRLECTYVSDGAGKSTLSIKDTQSGVQTTIEGVDRAPCPETPDEVITVWRIDASGDLTIWVGPYEHLVAVETTLRIRRAFRTLEPTGTFVLAAPAAAPDSLGLYALAADTFEATEVVPATLASAAGAAGGTFVGELSSASLSLAPLVWYGDHFLYGRIMSDGREVYFAGPMADGPRELAVASVRSFFQQVLFGSGYGDAGGPPTWVDPEEEAFAIRLWDAPARRLVSCPWPGPFSFAGEATADRRRLLFGGRFRGNAVGDQELTALVLMSPDGAPTGTCTSLAMSEVASAGLSRTGESLFWIGVTPERQWGLWVAAGDGANARLVGSGLSMKDGHFVDGTRLELTLDGDLVWLDTTEPAPKLHYVAENTAGFPIGLVDPWTISLYDFNAQDGTGTLGLVNRDTGSKQLVSRAVSSYAAMAQGFSMSIPDAVPLVYVVRGRHPSAQDGIWIATIPVGDLR